MAQKSAPLTGGDYFASMAKAMLAQFTDYERQIFTICLSVAGLDEERLVEACHDPALGRRICAVLELILRRLRAN